MTKTQPHWHLRFRLWHLFLTVTVIAFLLWTYTQAGMATAEIEIQGIQLETPRNGHQIVHSLDYRFLEPEELYQSMHVVFFRRPAAANEPVEVGKRIRFRYRARGVFWLKQQNPNTLAIRLLGLDEENINEIISVVQMPESNE
jgi:hypothetical protein